MPFPKTKMFHKIKNIIKFTWPIVAFCLFLYAFLNITYAADSLGGSWDQYLNDLPSFTAPTGATGEDLAANVIRRGISLVKYVMGGATLLIGIIYSIALIFSLGKEDTITKYRKGFLWIFFGFIILMISENVASIFNPETAKSDKLIDFKSANDQLRDIASYLKWIFGSVIVLLMTISGIRMVTAGDNEDVITKERKHLTWSGMGMLVILLANSIVNTIYVVKTSDGTVAAGSSTQAITEIGSIIRLLLVFLGPVAILFTIYAGFMYLTAFDVEDRAKKAKRMIVAGVTGVVIIYTAYALVNTFMVADLVAKTT